MEDDLGFFRGLGNALAIELIAFGSLVAIWLLWWAALPGLTT